VVPVKDENGIVVLQRDDFLKPDTDMATLAKPQTQLRFAGEMGFDAIALAKYTEVESINHVHTPGNSSGIVDGASLVMVGSEPMATDLGLTPRGRRDLDRPGRHRSHHHADRPRAGRAQGARQGWAHDRRHRPRRNQRGLPSVALRLQRDLNVPDEKLNVVRRVPSQWATRWGPPAEHWSRRCSMNWSAASSSAH